MGAVAVIGGIYNNLLNLHPLMKDNKFEQPARNLFRDNTLITDAIVQQANEMMGHTGSFQTSMPQGTVIKLGGWRATTTGSWGTFKEGISIYADAISTPKDIADTLGTSMLGEDEATHINSFGQFCENSLMYSTAGMTPDTAVISGTSTTATVKAQNFDGLACRFRTPDNGGGAYDFLNPDPSTAAQKGVIDAGSTQTYTTSIWFVRWGKRAASLITPLNDPQYGLRVEDLGLVTMPKVSTSTGEPTGYQRFYMTELEWKFGLCLYPGEYQGNHVCRIRNIDPSLSTNNAALKTLISQVYREYFNSNSEGLMMYVPPRLMTIFDVMYEAKSNVIFTTENPYQSSPNTWAGKIFIRQTRAISEKETYVAAV
jgi:hypothetical protein